MTWLVMWCSAVGHRKRPRYLLHREEGPEHEHHDPPEELIYHFASELRHHVELHKQRPTCAARTHNDKAPSQQRRSATANEQRPSTDVHTRRAVRVSTTSVFVCATDHRTTSHMPLYENTTLCHTLVHTHTYAHGKAYMHPRTTLLDLGTCKNITQRLATPLTKAQVPPDTRTPTHTNTHT